MADLWLISVPLDKTSITSVEKLKHTIAKTNLASYFMFPIPDLKVSLWSQREPGGSTKIMQSKCRLKDQLFALLNYKELLVRQSYRVDMVRLSSI